MKHSPDLSRRHFLGRAAAALALPAILPAGVLAQASRPGANDRIAVGYIGVGRRAQQLMHLPDSCDVVAYSDVNRNRLEAMQAKNPRAAVFPDYREMLASETLDAVVIATPDHWHALHSIHAMEAGKDVYVEKPMTLTIREGRLMVEAARKHGRICQVGSQQRSMAPCQRGCEIVREGLLGKIHTIHGDNYPSPWECDLPEEPVPEGIDWDFWCGPVEVRPYNKDLYLPRAEGRKDAQGRPLGWISFRPYSGGEMTGWGAHGLDIIQWAMDADTSGPVEVWTEGEGLTAPVSMRYANGAVVKLDGKGPGGGALFEGEEGSILVDRGKYELKLKSKSSDLPDRMLGGEEDHLAHWAQCIQTRERPRTDVEIGHRSTTMCHLGNIARWTGRKLNWDPEAERFVEDAEANAYLDRERRAPWALG